MVGLGLFAPLPLAVMIPFMAGQSFAMGEAFGKGFQYGKRRISSMTNEKFNAMTASDHFSETTADIKAMIPAMSSTMETFHTLQTDIILKMIDYIAKLPAEVLPSLASAAGEIDYKSLITAITQAGGNISTQVAQQVAKSIIPKAHASVAPPLPSPPSPSNNQSKIDEIARQEQLRQESAARRAKAVIDAAEREANKNKTFVTGAFKATTPAQSRASRRTLLKDSLKNIARQINTWVNRRKIAQSNIAKWTSTQRALETSYNQATSRRRQTIAQSLRNISVNIAKEQPIVTNATAQIVSLKALTRKTQDMLDGIGSF